MELHSDDHLDERVVTAMRSLYSAPPDAGYWDSLQSRIVARLSSAGQASRDNGWLSVLATWATPGLAAAALIFAVAGALLIRLERAERTTTTYEGFTQRMLADALPGATELLDLPHDGTTQREATLTYVLSH